MSIDRRDFLGLLAMLGAESASNPLLAASGSYDSERDPGAPAPGTYRPGRIDNEYALLLPGEREALEKPPVVSSLTSEVVTIRHGDQTIQMRPHDETDGWRLLTITAIDSVQTAVFEKHVTHRGAIAYVTAQGVSAIIPKQIGELSNIRPRQINTPHGVRFQRATHYGPDTVGQYILSSTEDPCYENVAALGAEYVGWTLVANEEAGPQRSLYLESSGKSRELNPDSGLQVLWAPDAASALFDPTDLIFQSLSEGFSSKRTLLGGYLPVADLAVWDPTQQSGYEVIVLLPPGRDAKPMVRLRSMIAPETLSELEELKSTHPELIAGVAIFREKGRTYIERYWNGSAGEFHTALASLWSKWRGFHESALQVDIPDEWLLNAARAGITLARCSYTGLDPTYQIGEGGYTKTPPSSHALFPVAHYEFIWAHQLWNHCASADTYFQHYLEHYVLPDGNFTYNTQDQVEAPLNVGIFLANSARAYFYTLDLKSLEKRLPILERMMGYVLERYDYSKTTFPPSDRRHGLIWGSPEADLGDPKKDTPADHPYFYQNAVCVWRGLEQHARALKLAAQNGSGRHLSGAADRYQAIAQEMRAKIQASLAATLAACSSAMRTAGITPFNPDDINHDPTQLESYENHRFMEDWFLADWGDPALDLGHLKHRVLAGRQSLGLGTSGLPYMTSNFMAHGTLNVLIRQDDYRPFLLSLYALTCYAADSGNRYAPEDAFMPGGHPLEGSAYAWSAVVNSTLQPALGLRWLLCYEETDADVCHLQKAAPRHWFANGETIAVRNCPTRFGTIGWSTRSLTDRQWKITVDLPRAFAGDLVIHVHAPDGRPLHKTSSGRVQGDSVVFQRNALQGVRRLQLLVS